MAGRRGFHEDLKRGAHDVGPDRVFGLVFASVFAIIALAPLVNGGGIRFWALAVGGAFLVLAVVVPGVLHPANLVWSRFGLLLHRVVTPVVIGLVFVVAFVPTGLIMRMMGKDPMRRGFDQAADTYWIRHKPPGPAPETMKNQF